MKGFDARDKVVRGRFLHKVVQTSASAVSVKLLTAEKSKQTMLVTCINDPIGWCCHHT